MQYKISCLSPEDVDHFIKNYDKNIGKLVKISQDIAQREAKIEHGAGSIIKIINDKSARDNNNVSVDSAKLITEISMLHDEQSFTRFKLHVVDQVIGWYRLMKREEAGMMELRKKGYSFDKIASELNTSKMDVYRDVQEAYKFAIRRFR